MKSISVDVLIVTINYKTPELVIELCESLALEGKEQSFHLVIVDNASKDNSASLINDYLQSKKHTWITFIQAEDNLGYAAGNNTALEYANEQNIDYKYIWFLNPDTRVYPKAGVYLQSFIEDNNVHAVGSRLEDSDGTLQCSHFNFPGVRSELSSGLRLGIVDKVIQSSLVRRPPTESAVPTDWLAGASFMVTKSYIEKVGLMDADYFLYFEELDFCLKGNRLDMPCWYVPKSRVYHAVGASTGISDHRKAVPRRPKYWFDSRRRFYLKNYGAMKLVLCDLAFLFGYSIWQIRKLVSRSPELQKEPQYFLRDFFNNSFICRGFKF